MSGAGYDSSNRMRPGLTTATQNSGLPLPEPKRVSAGVFVTGLSGNTLIHTLPPKLAEAKQRIAAAPQDVDAVLADLSVAPPEARTGSGRVGVKVWLYKGDIVPYKTQSQDKISREAAMAAGETSGQVMSEQPAQARKFVSSAGPRVAEPTEEVTPLVKEADPEFERLLEEEEAIERRLHDSHETPKLRGED